MGAALGILAALLAALAYASTRKETADTHDKLGVIDPGPSLVSCLENGGVVQAVMTVANDPTQADVAKRVVGALLSSNPELMRSRASEIPDPTLKAALESMADCYDTLSVEATDLMLEAIDSARDNVFIGASDPFVRWHDIAAELDSIGQTRAADFLEFIGQNQETFRMLAAILDGPPEPRVSRRSVTP